MRFGGFRLFLLRFVWGWQVFGVFEAFVFEPENVQVGFVSLHQLGVCEGFEAFCWFAVVAVLGL